MPLLFVYSFNNTVFLRVHKQWKGSYEVTLLLCDKHDTQFVLALSAESGSLAL